MSERKCASCGETDLEPGVIVEGGEGVRAARYLPNPEYGVLGGLKVFGRDKFALEAMRCRTCSYLNTFVGDPT
jgi:hypothetical protein